MFTPQQIDQISFGKATFGGYNMDDVDEFLEPLCEDYITLYKENALLKSKMRVLVGKLEEYRKNEAAMKEAVANAQKTCDKMVHEAELKCKQMIASANTSAAQTSGNAGELVAAEEARVEEARKLASSKIDEIQEQMRSCIQALDRIKQANQPKAEPAPATEEVTTTDADAVADEIAKNLESLVGTAEDIVPKAAPQPASFESTTAKFANLQFGRNYDTKKK